MTLLDCVWSPPPADPVLSHNEIHLWRASLDQPVSLVEQLGQTLSADERTQAERYHFARDRQHFIVGRGLLRKILGAYLGMEPGRLQFRPGPYGKPALVSSGSAPRFNLSHSHGLALYAFTREREIGVDLEYIHPIAEAEQIAESYFSAQANDTLRNLPPSERYEQFFTYWTRMEAYLKARGDGLTGLSQEHDESCHTSWSIQSFIPAPGYRAALAVQRHDSCIVCYQWT
jgi:4'-phosphopantetheinyl transferase